MSTDDPPKLRQMARRLLAYEAVPTRSDNADDSAAFRVCEKLRGSLSKVMGPGGFRSLLTRAHALSGAEVPALRALQIRADGSLAGLGELRKKLDPPALADREAVLVMHLLGLLVIFLGHGLTLRLLCDIWPKLDELENRDEGTS